MLLSVNCVWVYWTLLQGFITSDNKRLYKCINHINSVNSLSFEAFTETNAPDTSESSTQIILNTNIFSHNF